MEGEKKMVGQRDMVCEREMAGEKAWNSYARACLLVVAEMEGEKEMVGQRDMVGEREMAGEKAWNSYARACLLVVATWRPQTVNMRSVQGTDTAPPDGIRLSRHRRKHLPSNI